MAAAAASVGVAHANATAPAPSSAQDAPEAGTYRSLLDMDMDGADMCEARRCREC